MSTALFEIKDRSGRPIREVPNVLAPVALTGVSTTSASNILTVASTTGVYPGMGVNAPNIPANAFVHAVKSATELELWASTFNASTGVWTTSAANAQATANGSSMLAYAGGGAVEVTKWYAEGNWRNIFRGASGGAFGAAPGLTAQPGYVPLVTNTIGSGGSSTWTLYPNSILYATSDDFAATPLKRHEGVPRSVWILISTGGFRSTHLINPGDSCGYAEAEA